MKRLVIYIHGKDDLTSIETVSAFAQRICASLTVMEDGEHWFHTDEQMRFLDSWIETSIRSDFGFSIGMIFGE